jgi:hypothetical protein
MDEELANEAIQELSDVWYKYSDAFENPVYIMASQQSTKINLG